MAIVLYACGEEQELADISTEERDGYTAIIWEEETYIQFCVVSKNNCEALLYKEVNVADIPDGLQSEYEWND